MKNAGQPRQRIIQISHRPTNAPSMTVTRLTKAKRGHSPTFLVVILKHLRQQEAQKRRRARVPCRFLLHRPFLWASEQWIAAIVSSCLRTNKCLTTHSSNVPSSSFTFSQLPSSSTFQHLYCKYPKLLWVAINQPSQLFTSRMSEQWDFKMLQCSCQKA